MSITSQFKKSEGKKETFSDLQKLNQKTHTQWNCKRTSFEQQKNNPRRNLDSQKEWGASEIVEIVGAPGWLSQLGVQLLVPAQVMISRFISLSPHQAPCSQHRACLVFSLSLSLSAPPLLFLSLKINKLRYRGTWLAQSVDHVTLDLWVVRPSHTLDMEII